MFSIIIKLLLITARLGALSASLVFVFSILFPPCEAGAEEEKLSNLLTNNEEVVANTKQ